MPAEDSVAHPPLPGPGWYPDGPFTMRWWDGSSWTEHRAQAIDVGTAPAARSSTPLIIGLGLGVLLLVGSFAGYAYFSGKAHDPRSLDDETIRRTAASACQTLAEALESSSGTRVERIAAGNVGIEELVLEMRSINEDALRDDPPSLDWIADWEQLSAARSTFATDIASGGNDAFVIPQTSDGYPITERMADVAPEACGNAVTLAATP